MKKNTKEKIISFLVGEDFYQAVVKKKMKKKRVGESSERKSGFGKRTMKPFIKYRQFFIGIFVLLGFLIAVNVSSESGFLSSIFVGIIVGTFLYFVFDKILPKMKNRKKTGFTLIELLIVIAILGILATIIFTSLTGAREKARIARAKSEVKQIYKAVIMLESDSREWPGHKDPYERQPGESGNEICPDGCTFDLNDCRAGLVCNPDPPNDYINWDGPYIKSLTDPWGNGYFFDTDYDVDPTSGEEWVVAVGSYGPNGVGRNLYDQDDIIYIIPAE